MMVMVTDNAKVFSLLRLAIPEYGGYDNYVSALRDAGMVENRWQNNMPLDTYGDGTINAIKVWHDTPNQRGVACIIERYVSRDKGILESVEFYQYKGTPDAHRRINIFEDFDYTTYIEDMIEFGVLEWRQD